MPGRSDRGLPQIPGQPTPAGLLAEEMGAWTQNLAASGTANASASSDNGYRYLDADSGWELGVECGRTEVPDDSPLPTTVTAYNNNTYTELDVGQEGPGAEDAVRVDSTAAEAELHSNMDATTGLHLDQPILPGLLWQAKLEYIGNRVSLPSDSSLICGSSGHSGWI